MQDYDWNYNQPVDGDGKVFMCIVDYDLADGQLAHAAGGTPSKPHEWMVRNLLSPYPSTLAMHAQSDSGACGKLIVSEFINAEDNKATEVTEQKTEQTAPASSPGLVHHPKVGSRSYTQYGNWSSAQSANGDGVRYSNLVHVLRGERPRWKPAQSQHADKPSACLGGGQPVVALL
jgi:hypothetical protein